MWGIDYLPLSYTPSSQSMFTVHSKLHANEHIFFLTVGAQAQPSHQDMKENPDEKDSGINSSKDYFHI